MVVSQSNTLFFKDLPGIVAGRMLQYVNDLPINELITDNRKASLPADSTFLAIKGINHNGHDFIYNLYHRGCRQFIVEQGVSTKDYPGSNIFLAESSLDVLQKISTEHRQKFQLPVIGVTGSNGKTIVKEWLHQLLSNQFTIVKNPGSYNSQLGVPLSVWAINAHHNLAIFEAGISQPGEMERLEKIIQPTIGIFTNLLNAHDEGFASKKEKAKEKAKLFLGSEVVIYCKNHELIDEVLKEQHISSRKYFTWGFADGADVVVTKLSPNAYRLKYQQQTFTISQKFTDAASWENIFHCITVMLYLKCSPEIIQDGISQLRSLPMRLEMKEGLNGSTLFDDTYSNDLSGLKIALYFFNSQRGEKSVVILSDMMQTGLQEAGWITQVNSLLNQYQIERLITIGEAFQKNETLLTLPHQCFLTVDDFFKGISAIEFSQATILVKGARAFRLERIVQKLEKKIHGTVMEINLGALVHNLNAYRALLKPSTKIMAMVKAFAYGSGSHEVATLLQYHKADYLGVAYADEGKVLRESGIHLPIMVMNAATENFQTLIDFQLEASVYSITLLNALIEQTKHNAINIHLKLDTGMHRLGFEEHEIEPLIKILTDNPQVKIKSIYTHLAASDEVQHDSFSDSQVAQFNEMSNTIVSAVGYPVLKHALNTAGISRFSKYQMDMVRMGIGLYGIDPASVIQQHLKTAVTVRTTISQIKKIKSGETIGYGRHGKATQEMTLATLAIGYADGFSRAFSKGIGKVLIHGKLAPVVGNVCMDMTMVDITGIDANESDTAIIFGNDLPVTHVASCINTIPYEILTNTSDRVKRVFYTESI